MREEKQTVKSLRERTIAWALQSESAQRIRACLDLARCLPPIADAGSGWNEVRHKLAAGNAERAVVNLPLGVAEHGVKGDKISFRTPVPYDPAAEAPRWERFLEEIFPNVALRAYIQHAVGYSATGETSEQCFFFCHGGGANGKTTFLSAVRHVLGDYAYTLPFAVLERARGGGESASPYLADLEGRRFVTASEVNDNTKLDEGRIKELTGDGLITARHLYKAPFTYRPQLKLWLAVNHKPAVYDDSDAFWRRVRFIPFTAQFKGDAIDTLLLGKLIAEAPGILRWAVAGAVAWYEARDAADGRPVLDDVPGSDELMREWRRETDPVQEFIDAYCVVKDGCRVERSELYEGYLDWANSIHLPTKERLTRVQFIRRVTNKYESKKSGGTRMFLGIGLLKAPQMEGF